MRTTSWYYYSWSLTKPNQLMNKHEPMSAANIFVCCPSQSIACSMCPFLPCPPHLPSSIPTHPATELCALRHRWSKCPSPVCHFFTLPPVLTSPLRYPIASPAAKHLLLGENLLLGNRFLKQQLWLCCSLNSTSPAWNNERAWLLVHLCVHNPLENDRPLPTGMCLPFSSLLFTAHKAERFKIEVGVLKLLIAAFHQDGSSWETSFPVKTPWSCNSLL